MSDQGKTGRTVQLVAVERGFVNGETVEPGTSFVFDRTPHPDTPAHKLAEDGLRRLPKWAKPKDEARKAIAAKAAKLKVFDTRPVPVKNAVQRKNAAMTGSDEPEAKPDLA